MKVIVTGASGMVGKGVLIECLENNEITQVLSIGRKTLGMNHPKLKEMIHKDFSEFDSVKDELKGYDACFHCMGVSSASFGKEAYYKMTYGFTMALAKTLFDVNPESTFTYVSGQGTDSKEKGTGWAAVKGKTENDLLAMGFKQAFMFRPGGILPVKGAEPSGKVGKRLMKSFTWLIKLIKTIAPNSIVNTSQVGIAMIQVAKNGYSETIINPKDILKLSKA